MSRNVQKRTPGQVRPTKTQISLRIRAVRSEFSFSAWRNFASLAIQNAPSEDSDQIARMRRLIWIFAGRTCHDVRFLTLRFNWFATGIFDTLSHRVTCLSFNQSPFYLANGSRERREPTSGILRRMQTAKLQIRLRMCVVWSGCSLFAMYFLEDPKHQRLVVLRRHS